MKSCILLALFLSTAAGTASAQATPSACSGMSLGANGALNGFVPSPNDAWHQNISSAPVDPMSSTIINVNGISGTYLHPGFSSVADGDVGIPYVVVDSSTQALSPIAVTDFASQSDITLMPIPANMPVEGNPVDCNTSYASTGDAHAIILDRATCVAYEIAQADHCATTVPNWTGAQTSIWDFTENEQRPLTWTSVDAAGLSVFEGLVRYDEIEAGVINHAIRFTASLTKNDDAGGYFVPPATHAAGNNWETDNVIGMRIRLKASFDISGFSPTNQIILTAMKQYGMILADNGQSLYFQGTPDARWNDTDLYNLRSVVAADFDVVDAPGSGTLSPDPGFYTAGTAPIYPNGSVMDAYDLPTGNPPTNSLTASATSISAGQSVTLTPSSSGASYNFIDNAGFVRGPVTVSPTATTTYTLYSNNAYGSTTSTPVTVTVGSVSAPTLAFASIPSQTLGAAPFSISATSNSTGAMTFSVLSGGATVIGQTVTLTAPGTVTLQVSQAASGNYSAATATTTFTVLGQTPTVSFSIANQTFPGSPFAVAATSNSTGAITYSVVSGPATLSGATLTLTGSGQVTVIASQAASGNFTTGSATATFTVLGQTPTLSFSIANQTFPGSPFTVAATSNSTGAITYSVVSGPAALSGTTLALTGAGTVTVLASQAAFGNFTAGSATATFTVLAETPTLSFSIGSQTYPEGAFTIGATSNSSGAITYSVASGPATVSGTSLTLTGAGQVTVTASQAASGNFTSGSAIATFTASAIVSPPPPIDAPQTILFNPLPNFTHGTSYQLTARTTSGLPVSYIITSGGGYASISDNVLTVNAADGSVTIQASTPVDPTGAYALATPVSRSFTSQ